MIRFHGAVATAALFSLALAACGGGATSSTAGNGAGAGSTTLPATTATPAPAASPSPAPAASPAPAPVAGPAPTPAAVANVASIVVDGGPTGGSGDLNAPFVSVTICPPGSSACQTIDHVLLDTGSFGLRLVAPGVISAAASFPSVNDGAGNPLGECAQFVSGYTWGAVHRADVKLAGEVATAIPVEFIGDTSGAGVGAAPSTCSGTGANLGTVAGLGANGILGLGLFVEDCGSACAVSTAPGFYYACHAGSCTPATVPLVNQVANPVPSFAGDNNGVVLALPAVGAMGAGALSGTLTFGIGTRSNNGLGGATPYAADQNANFSTTYKGVTSSFSFIDSGSNGLFFADASIAACARSVGFYCPATPLTITAVNHAASGSASSTVSATLVMADGLAANIVAAPLGGPFGSSFAAAGFDWGLPFFYGRSVYVAIERAATPAGVGPYWAY
jgi:hypothetical protein